MITSTQLYWLTRLDNICNVSAIIAFISALAIILTVVPYAVIKIEEYGSGVESSKALLYIIKKALLVLAISLPPAIFTPTAKEMAAILVIPQIANSEKVQAVGGKLYDLAVEWMDELKPKHEAKERR